MSAKYFTVKEFLAMELIGMPKTSAGMHQKINREGWAHQLRGGRGGKAGGNVGRDSRGHDKGKICFEGL